MNVGSVILHELLPQVCYHRRRLSPFRFILVATLAFVTGSLSAQDLQIDSLKQLLAAQPKNKHPHTLRILSGLLSSSGQADSAIAVATRALHVSEETGSSMEIIRSEYHLGRLYLHQRNDTLSILHFRKGISHAVQADEDSLVAKGQLEVGRFYLKANAPRKAIAHLNQALSNIDEKKDADLSIAIFSGLGDSYKSLGIYTSATEYYLKALRRAEDSREDLMSADLFNSIGTVYMRTGDYADALDYFDRALKIYETHSDNAGIVSSMMNTGVIYQKQEKLQDAIDVYQRVLPRTKALKDLEKEAIVTGNIGSTMASQGKLQQGLLYLKKALELKEQAGNIKRTLHTLNDIANVNILLGDAAAAKQAAEKVIHLAPAQEGWDQLRFGYLNLSRSYKLVNDYRNAHRYLEKYNSLNDSLFGIQKAQQINELQIQYDTERKDMAIHSLRQEKQIANAQRNNYILIGAVVTLMLVILYLHQRQKTRRNQQLLEKEREIDRLKSDFFANISHEFRTPLSLILGPLDTMLGKVQDTHMRFQLELMKKSASRLLRLINQILELSKLQFGRPELKASATNGVDLIRGVTSTFQSLAESRGISLEFESDHDNLTLYCNEEQIETVCINLISNAFKFTDTTGVIKVCLQRVTEPAHPDGMLEFQVRDNGIGIAKEHLDHIFDRFYRVGSSSEKQYGGTGIGLALTRELVILHHGTIDIESEPGRGTAVTVRIPMGKSHLSQDQLVTTHKSAPQSAAHSDLSQEHSPAEVLADTEPNFNGKPLILLIDDNEDVRSYIKSILEETYILLEAPDGSEGVRMAKAFIPDLIISDVMMPLVDGYEVCRRLKKDEKTSHIPLILLTAKTSVGSRLEGLETEADLYLGKPFVPQELLLCIHNLILSRKKLRDRYNREMVLKPVEIAINSTDEMFLQRLMKVLEDNYADESFSVEQLSSEIGMSRSQLHRKLQALTNESASQFIRTFRLQRAMEFLKKNHGSISEIAFKVGFASAPYFNRCFLQHYGCTPSSVVEKGERLHGEEVAR